MFFAISPTFATLFAQAAESAAPAPVPGAAGGSLWSLLPFILMFAGFWFLFIRPQQKRQKEIQQKQSQLKVGDNVLTSAGIYGKVVGLDNDRVTLQVGEGVRIPFQRAAIIGFLNDDSAAK